MENDTDLNQCHPGLRSGIQPNFMSYLFHPSYKSNRFDAGFTIIEILVVLGIFVLISGFALFVSMDSYRGTGFRSERDTIISVLQKARSQAISNICLGSSCTDGQPHGVHFDSNQYVIFQGSSYSAGAPANQIILINNKVTITDLSGNPPPDIIFKQLDGSVAGVWNIIVKDTAGHSSQISVNTEGQIDNP